jgi:monovalent cation:proton antiporter-2 (CPA2) family protein
MENFVQEALVFIGSSLILVPIFQKLRFGSVLGYLMAGIVVGPYALKLIQDAHSVSHLAELGVILLLFVIGLEIQPRKLWSMRRQLFGLGGLQILVCTLVFSAIAYAFGLTPIASAVVGFSLSLSSTAFAMQTLAERNQLNTPFGQSSFAILLMQDMMAIPALAIIPLLTKEPVSSGTTSSGSFGQSGILIAFAIVIAFVIVSRYFIRPLFRIIANTRTREIFTAMTLFIVLGVAGLMQEIGLSAALGTFIAGVLLADSEYRHEIEASIEPFKSLLMGLFFIAVGMGVSLDVIIAQPFLIFTLSLGYLLLKTLLVYASGRAFRQNHEIAKMMALTISQGGEFAFVIFGITAGLNIASAQHLLILTAVITLSMAMSPLLGLAHDEFQKRRRSESEAPNYDQIQGENAQVIVAGFGRFGQIFGRMLRTRNIPFIAIDHDADQIELLRKFGNKVYYGDASKRDLLESAGAGKAKYFILCIDDVETSLATAKVVVEHFPNLKVFARARNRGHAFELMEMGIRHIKRETFDSSVYFVQELLEEMGTPLEQAKTLIERFKKHDEIMLQEQFKVRSDDKMFVSVSKQAVAQLAEVLAEDSTKSYIAPSPTQESLET